MGEEDKIHRYMSALFLFIGTIAVFMFIVWNFVIKPGRDKVKI